MTTEQFKAAYGAEYGQFTNTPLFSALMAVADDASPSRQAPTEHINNSAQAGATLYWQIQGWEAFRALLTKTLTTPPESELQTDDYKTPPILPHEE